MRRSPGRVKTQRTVGRGNYYYWIVANDNGQTWLIYGGITQSDAQIKAVEQLNGIPYEIRTFPTRNQAAASAMLKGKKLEQTKDLRKATQRLRHTRRRK